MKGIPMGIMRYVYDVKAFDLHFLPKLFDNPIEGLPSAQRLSEVKKADNTKKSYMYPLAALLRYLLAKKVVDVEDLVIPGGLVSRIKWTDILAFDQYRRSRGCKVVASNSYKILKFLEISAAFWGTVTKEYAPDLYLLKTR